MKQPMKQTGDESNPATGFNYYATDFRTILTTEGRAVQ
jgi:hypothetical protein